MHAYFFIKPGRILTLIILLCMIACADKPSSNADDTTTSALTSPMQDSFPAGKITTVVCRTDASQSYALYTPAKNTNEKFAVIYFFDPHADEALPLKKYKALADKYNFVLIGSNNSKNGNDWTVTENIWRSLFDDSRNRLQFDHDRIYACGFSGGAKVAGYIALHHTEIKGVIANGAGLPDETPAGNFNFSFTAIAGEGDMNMTDLVSITTDLDKTQTRHRIIFFKGKHEWAPEATMNIAFEGLLLDGMRDKLIPNDEAFISDYISESKKKLDAFSKTNDLIKADKECTLSINMLGDLTNEVDWFREKDASIKNSPAFQNQLAAKENLFTIEQNKKTEYNRQFQQGDMNYWIKAIADLQSKVKAQTDEGAMYQRLLAYLSLAFYSISNQFITANQNKEAEYFVDLYKKADPTNAEAWYFSAILDARNNDARSTEDDLLKAVANGFTDKVRMMQQPEFKDISTKINLSLIESKMKTDE